MPRVEKLLDEWVAKGLISADQAQKIASYQSTKQGTSWAIYGFLTLGAFIIGIGVISLIAANWKTIPDFVKLSIDFLFMIFLSAQTYYAIQKNRQVLTEVLLIVSMLFCAASIGLIAQVYHTYGALNLFFFLWSICTLGLAALSKRFFAPFLWATGFLAFIASTAIKEPMFELVFQREFLSVAMSVPLMSTLIAIGGLRFGGGTRNFLKAFGFLAILGVYSALLVLETNAPLRHVEMKVWKLMDFIPGYALALFLAVAIVLCRQFKKVQKILLLFFIGLYAFSFSIPALGKISEIIYSILFLTALATMALFWASLRERLLFQIFLICMSVRFLILYFEAFGGLARTGLGLILSGIILVCMVLMWIKFKQKITTWAEGVFE